MMIFSKSFNRLTITPKYTTQRTFRVPTSGSSSSQYLFSCKRVVISRNFTDAVTDQKKHFEQLAQKLGVEKPEAWFKLKQADVQKHGGELLKQYGSLLSALPSVFPELNNVWKDKRNHRQYFEALKPQLGVKSPDDWYTLDANAIMAVIDPALLTQYYQGSFLRALEDAYPEVTFAEDKFQTSVRDLVLQAPKKRKESAAPATPKPLSEAALARKAALERVSLPSNPSGINYTVRRGKSRGVPTCRGCKRAFEDKSELRIQTTLLYEAPGLDPRPVTVNFCINQACLSTALKNYKKKDSVIHPFNGKVEVPSDIPKSELPTDAEGIVFVQTDTPSTPATTTAAATN